MSESCTNCTDKKAKWCSNAAHDADVVHFFFSDELYSIAGFPLRIQWVLHQHPSYQDIQKGGRNGEGLADNHRIRVS